MSALEALRSTLEQHGSVRENEPLSRHTTFGIGGPADLFVTVRDRDALAAVVRATRDAGQPLFILGSGSNILVADAGIRGVVVDNRARAEQLDDTGYGVRIESGASFAAFSRKACRDGKDGLTWAVGIPGTFGGAVVYNAGAYGGCLADVLESVELLDEDGTAEWVPAADLHLVYRGSMFTRGQFANRVVLGVQVQLTPGDSQALLARATAHDQKRLTAQPRGRNAGSMFKNPSEAPAWKLIDSVGLRGATRGDAAISEQHCNFFVNYGHAKAADVASLVAEAERRVREQFGVQLEREVAFVGDWQ